MGISFGFNFKTKVLVPLFEFITIKWVTLVAIKVDSLANKCTTTIVLDMNQ